MSARALLEELRGRGVEFAPDGKRLRSRSKEIVTPELLDRLKAYKPRLPKLLEWEQRKLEGSDVRGFVVRWSEHPEWIRLHDPLSGEGHEVRASECLPGVLET